MAYPPPGRLGREPSRAGRILTTASSAKWGNLRFLANGAVVRNRHFTAEDLLGTRVATGPAAAWELLLSLHVLQPHSGVVFRPWRAEAVRALTDSMWLRDLLALTPARGYSPDFLTPPGDLDQAVDTIMRTPVARLRSELPWLAGKRTMPRLAAGLLAGERDARKRLAEAAAYCWCRPRSAGGGRSRWRIHSWRRCRCIRSSTATSGPAAARRGRCPS